MLDLLKMNPLPPKQNVEATKKRLRQIFLILLLFGLSLGVILSFGLVKLLEQWGLTDRPQPTQVRE